ncbi:MAG: hypothetical protein ACTSPS_17735 [Promethearchaeota archaeon]
MAMRYGNGELIEDGEWHFLGKIEENDSIFKDIDLTPFIGPRTIS